MQAHRCSVVSTFLLLVGTAWAQNQQPKDYAGYSVITVTANNREQIDQALNFSETIWSERAGLGSFQVVANAQQLATLAELGLMPVVDLADLGPLIAAEQEQINLLAQAKNTWFQSYQRTPEIHSYLNTLAADFPALTSMEDVGDSLQGRDLLAIRITGPGDVSARPAIFLNGGQHAREWISPSTVTYIADQLLRNYGSDPLITELVDSFEWIILPVVNPDGYEYTWDSVRLWRKNRRNNGNGTFGVDLNRNWDIDFGGTGASANTNSDIYHGPSAFSEPETAAVSSFINNEPRIIAHIDFHCFSQLILYPWGYEGAPALTPTENAFYTQVSDDMAQAILNRFGADYTPQPSIDLYPAAGTMGDWTADQGLRGWTIELRPDAGTQSGFILPPEQILPVGIENLEAVKAMSSALLFPFAISPLPENPDILTPGASATVSFSIRTQPGASLSGTPELLTRIGNSGAFASSPLTYISGTTWSGQLPAAANCQSVQYAVSALSADGRAQSFPLEGVANPLDAQVLTEVSSLLDDMETDTGWVVGAPEDNATSGIWNRMAPQQTAAQPGQDASPDGTICWITDGRAGTGLGSFDVDGGRTTLTSPLLNATDAGGATVNGDVEAILSYARWYSNDQGASPNTDAMPVEISNDNGQTWTTLEIVSENANAWVTRQFRVRDFVEPTDAMRVRFIAADYAPGSIVEAGVDDLRLDVFACTGKIGDIADDFGTLGPDGVVSFGDFLALLGLIGPCPGGTPGCVGDIADDFGTLGGDGQVSFGDFLALLGLID